MVPLFRFTLVILLVGFVVGCTAPNNLVKDQSHKQGNRRAPNYALLADWAAHPHKWDASDSVPLFLRNTIFKDSLVDVFFVHPTSFTNRADNLANADIDDTALNLKTDESAILFQASVFNEQCRVFAPRYRQAHYGNYFSTDSLRSKAAFELAYTDVKQAFEYYLKYYNAGRPIIIAAHSQGAQHAARILKEYFEGQLLQHKLVCAYLIGMPISTQYFTQIPACADSLATGCFVSWRSFKKGYPGPAYVQAEKQQMVVTNPLTWRTDSLPAPRSRNLGSVIYQFNKKGKPVSAQVHHNILWTSKPRFFGSLFLSTKNYHIGDINLFYCNIRQNVRTRIGMYWKH